MSKWDEARRELLLYGLLAALPAFAVAALFHIHPWATPMRQQADLLGWALTAIYVVFGALAVLVLPWTQVARTPDPKNAGAWTRLGLISLGTGLLYGLSDVALNRLTPWGAHLAAVDRHNGLSNTFINVHPPWSLAHYFHASIISECAFRLGPILLLTWLVSRVVLRGRFEAAAYWTVALLAALIEPLEKSILLRKWGALGSTPMEVALNIEAIAWQFVYAILMRRFGWPAPILARFGYYLIARCFIQ
jgi:hypothetical protein